MTDLGEDIEMGVEKVRSDSEVFVTVNGGGAHRQPARVRQISLIGEAKQTLAALINTNQIRQPYAQKQKSNTLTTS